MARKSRTDPTMTLEAKRDICNEKVTINGNRAKITGYNQPFATVTDLTTGLSAQWAWATALRVIVMSDGRFRS